MTSRNRALTALGAWLAAAILSGASLAASQCEEGRPYLFGCGRYTASWSGRPRSYDQQCWDHMVNIGVTMTGAGLAWCDAEPVQGQYDWDAIDYADFQVDEILARGMEPTFFLGLSPQWAALRPDLPPHRTPPSEDYVDEFMDFHRFVADRYRGRVRYYFFWNEPNGCSWINDGCSNSDGYPLYTQWLIRCSQAVKSVDPDAKIVAANIDYHSGVTHGYEYVQGMYDCGAGPYFDYISIHPYDWAGTIHWQAVIDTRNVMVANGDAEKGLWLSEYGWNNVSQEEQANRLTQVLTELKKPEWDFVVQANYLVLNDGSGVENYGLMDADLNARPAYYAFRDFDKTFPVSVISGQMSPGWQLISLPVPPSSPDPAEVFVDHLGSPIPISGNLHRYDHAAASYRTYFDFSPGEFGDVEWGDGYWLYLQDPTIMSHVGSASTDFRFVINTPGWYLIGCPQNVAIPLTSVQVTNVAEGRKTTLYNAVHIEGWVAPTLFWYNPSQGSYATCGFDPWHDTHSLAGWKGYWLYAVVGDLSLTMPCAP